MSVESVRAGMRSGARLKVEVYADYLCPWCWPAASCLWELQRRYPGAIELEHRAFILLGDEEPREFTDYHLEHRRAAKQRYGLSFHIPQVGDRYPTSSLPALEAAKWVQRERPDRFPDFDLALYEAFFRETRDISNIDTLAEIARTLELPAHRLRDALYDREFLDAVRIEHRAAEMAGVTVIPTARINGQALEGSQPCEAYEEAVAEVIGLQEPAPYD